MNEQMADEELKSSIKRDIFNIINGIESINNLLTIKNILKGFNIKINKNKEGDSY